MSRFSLALLLAAFLSFVAAWDINNEGDRNNCQSRTRNPLDGCDTTKTVFVGKSGKFQTVQSGKNARSFPRLYLLTKSQPWLRCQTILVRAKFYLELRFG